MNRYVEAPSNTRLRNPCRSLVNATILLITIISLIFTAGNYSIAFDSQKLLTTTAKRIIMVGVEVGLEEAGSRLLGPTAWKYFKRILSPIIDELKNRYPALSFDKPGDTKAREAAVAAAEHFSNDKQLQRMLLANFNDLKKGQDDIRAGMNRLEIKLEAVGEDVKTIVQMLRQQVVPPTGTLPLWIDVSDFVAEMVALALAKDPKAHNVLPVMAPAFGAWQFTQIVLEKGESFNTYRTRIYGFEYTIRAYGTYDDNLGRKCRKYRFSTQVHYADGKTSEKTYETKTWCRIEGIWQEPPE